MAFKHDPLAPALMGLVQHCIASHRGSGDHSIDSRGARAFWRGEQNGAARKIDLFTTVAKTEDSVGPEAGQCLIAKGELSTRIASGADSGALHHAIIYGRGMRRAL